MLNADLIISLLLSQVDTGISHIRSLQTKPRLTVLEGFTNSHTNSHLLIYITCAIAVLLRTIFLLALDIQLLSPTAQLRCNSLSNITMFCFLEPFNMDAAWHMD